MSTSRATIRAADQSDTIAAADDIQLIASLLAGDEVAFMTLISRYQRTMIRLAMIYVSDEPVAEEVVQETWMAVLKGLGQFEQRSSLKTWIFHILLYQARARGKRESRTIPFSALASADEGPAEPAVDPGRFQGEGGRWPRHWASPPQSWEGIPEERLLSAETREQIRRAIAALPHTQREVITLRDVEGWSPDEVCRVLNISEANQRVLLHRARSRVRQALEQYLNGV